MTVWRSPGGWACFDDPYRWNGWERRGGPLLERSALPRTLPRRAAHCPISLSHTCRVTEPGRVARSVRDEKQGSSSLWAAALLPQSPDGDSSLKEGTSPKPILFQRYHSALRVSRPSLRKATFAIHQAASNEGWAPPPRGGGSAAPLQCALKVLGDGGPGPPLPDAEIGGPGRLLRTFRRDEKYARPIKRQDEKSSGPSGSRTKLLSGFDWQGLRRCGGDQRAEEEYGRSAASIVADPVRSFRLPRSRTSCAPLARVRSLPFGNLRGVHA